MVQIASKRNRIQNSRNVVVERRFPRLKKKPQVDGRCFMTPEPSNVYFGANRVLNEPESYKLVVMNGRIEKLPVNGKEYQAAIRAHERAVQLCREDGSCRFELAKVLWEIREDEHFRLIGSGYSSFEDYREAELSVAQKTAFYLLECWKYYAVEYAHCPRMLQGAKTIGWTKAHSLLGIITPENMEEWFFFCETSTVKELATAVAEYQRVHGGHKKVSAEESSKDRLTRPARGRFGKQVGTVVRKVSEAEAAKEDATGKGFSLADILGEDPFAEEKKRIAEQQVEARPTPSHPETTEAILARAKEIHGDWTEMVFDVPTEDRAIVAQAIKAAQEYGKTKHRGVALVHVCTHFASEFTTDYREYIQDWFSVIERVTGLKVAAVDTEKRQIVYGEEFLQKEAKAS